MFFREEQCRAMKGGQTKSRRLDAAGKQFSVDIGIPRMPVSWGNCSHVNQSKNKKRQALFIFRFVPNIFFEKELKYL